MTSNPFRRLSPWAIVLVPALGLASCAQQEAAAPPATPEPVKNAVAAPTTPHWDYGTEHGPATWGSCCPEFAMCGTGRQQSPIDIPKGTGGALPELAIAYRPASLRVVHHEHVADGINNGHTVQVNCPGQDTLSVGGNAYALMQYHFHAPSEHTFGGRHYPMEMHMVHKAADGGLAVIGVFIEEGAHNAAFDPVWQNLPAEKGVETHYDHVTVSTDDLLPKVRSTYRYDGSLTTPPCSEGVKWFVMANPIRLSAEQLGAFTKIVNGNNRPVQPLNGRAIQDDVVAAAPTP